MAVDSVKLYKSSQTSSGGKRTGKKVYKVVLSGADILDAGVARTANDGVTAVPARGDAWSDTDTGLRCIGVDTGEPTEDSGQMFLVTADYSTATVADENENPLDDPDTWQLDYATSSEEKYVDRNNDTVTNSIGQTFDPPLQWEIDDAVVTITRNIAIDEFDLGMIIQSNNTINDSDFDLLGESIPAGCARIRITARKANKNNIDYVILTFVVMLRAGTEDEPRGWVKRVLDQGYAEVDEDGNYTLVSDTRGMPLNQPVKLDGSGNQLPGGGPAAFLSVEGYAESDFSQYNLPTTP
jgi:hypothetical protein